MFQIQLDIFTKQQIYAASWAQAWLHWNWDQIYSKLCFLYHERYDIYFIYLAHYDTVL